MSAPAHLLAHRNAYMKKDIVDIDVVIATDVDVDTAASNASTY